MKNIKNWALGPSGPMGPLGPWPGPGPDPGPSGPSGPMGPGSRARAHGGRPSAARHKLASGGHGEELFLKNRHFSFRDFIKIKKNRSVRTIIFQVVARP